MANLSPQIDECAIIDIDRVERFIEKQIWNKLGKQNLSESFMS